MERSSQIMSQEIFIMVITSPMTSRGGLIVDLLYFFINKIRTFFMIIKKTSKDIVNKLAEQMYTTQSNYGDHLDIIA